MNAYITLDIGGTHIRCALFTDENATIPKRIEKIKTVDENESAIDRIISIIESTWPTDSQVKGISAAAPGSVDVNHGTVILAPNIQGWKNIELRRILSTHFNVEVFVNNDARLAALGEWKRGAGIGHDNLLYFTISTGLGGGAICQGKLLEGSIGIATELGHITIEDGGPPCGCGKLGHLEAFSSGTGIENYYWEKIIEARFQQNKTRSDISAKVIASLAMEGDALARRAFERAGYYLGIGVSNYLHIFNPSCIILGGGVALSQDLFFESFNKSLESHVMSKTYLENLVIKDALLGDNAGLIGSLEYLKEHMQ